VSRQPHWVSSLALAPSARRRRQAGHAPWVDLTSSIRLVVTAATNGRSMRPA